MINKIKQVISAVFCKDEKPVKPPKWRLVPDGKGTYTLEKMDLCLGVYMTKGVYVRDKDHANELIENLERRVIYLVESE